MDVAFTILVHDIKKFVSRTDQLSRLQEQVSADQHEKWSKRQSRLFMYEYKADMQNFIPVLRKVAELLQKAPDLRHSESAENLQ